MPRPPVHVSFEFFPPKTEQAQEKLWQSVLCLAPYQPDFVSVTYGAGGSTRARTHQTVKRIFDETLLKPAAHLTCVGAGRTEINSVAQAYWDAGIRHVVALRGDPPSVAGETVPARYVPHAEGYAYTSDLIRGLKTIGDFEISVAAFPEKHPESNSFDKDMQVLAEKVEAGATRALTQYFFETDAFLRLRDKVARAGIDVALVPGLIPIGHFGQLKKFSAMCGATIPGWLETRFGGLDDNPVARDEAAIALVTDQAQALAREGVEQFHFYTMNRADLTSAICRNLGVEPA